MILHFSNQLGVLILTVSNFWEGKVGRGMIAIGEMAVA